MALTSFLLETVLISLSGVMAPGPISAVVVGRGSDSPYAGAWVAIGHGLVELPLAVLISWGLGRALNQPTVKMAIALGGGLLLLVMGVGMLRSLRQAAPTPAEYARFPLLAGVMLSLANPFFLVWWATVGAALIARALPFGAWGVAAFALTHWLCDLVWCSVLAILAFKGGRTLGARFQRLILVACGAMLFFFGGKYVIEAVRILVA